MADQRNPVPSPDTVRATVRARYAPIPAGAPGCCGPTGSTCCGSTPAASGASALGYSDTDAAEAPPGSDLGLGCGNPLAIQSLQPGEVALDLGCGAGFDAFLAARAVGPNGRVIGVDMTPEMLEAARANAEKAGRTNVEFRLRPASA